MLLFTIVIYGIVCKWVINTTLCLFEKRNEYDFFMRRGRKNYFVQTDAMSVYVNIAEVTRINFKC